MSVVAVGLNHTTAPIAVRERFAFARDALVPATSALAASVFDDRRGDAAIVSTCNRTELYLGADLEAVEPAMDWLAASGGITRDRLAPHAYVRCRATSMPTWPRSRMSICIPSTISRPS